MKTLIIIPVFNEVSNIKDFLKYILENLGKKEEILMIDDGSTDGSSEILSTFKDINMISHSKNQGYGQSLIDGFYFAIVKNYDVAITLDCDFQHCPEAIPVFEKNIGELNILSGSRYLNKIPLHAPKERVKVNQEITKLINKHTNLNITDAFCGFKAYSVEALKKLNLTEKGYGLPIQLWIQASKTALKIKEYPVKAIYCDRRRNFKGQFEDSQHRLKYYKQILFKELNKFKCSSLRK